MATVANISVTRVFHSPCSCASSTLRSSLLPSWPSANLACVPLNLSTVTNSGNFKRPQTLQKWRRSAKYVRFEVTPTKQTEPDENDSSSSEVSDESVLPTNLEGAVLQSSQSSAKFISAGGMRAIVELLLPELEFLNDEGAQEDLWQLAKLYLESLRKETGDQRLKAIFPDAGAAALLKHWWKDANFSFASLNDRKPVADEDEIIVMIAPDYQMLQSVERIASLLSDNSPRPLVMWNPRLFSGDVGIGLNVRRLRETFLRLWHVFLDDEERPGHFILAKEQARRPNSDDLDIIFLGGEADDPEEKPSFFSEAVNMFSSFNRFMRSLSK
ncbi:uncharacterized protein LOC131069600 isoform X2 [Cryptomeria japonica]|uniref:uncharacterized protein LOC131069600 isoform X2 n=1 Tax=Cryptomeria japonica TaxID=3369 RepID=UPI0027DA8847|nr:uncharacterized protein LOC131069600 isoform X2 [Cryptomeria japonica]